MDLAAVGVTVNAVAVVVLVFVTGYYARQTRETVREMRRSREAQFFPHLKLEVGMLNPTTPVPRVRNVGVASAIDASVTITAEIGDVVERIAWQAQVVVPHEYQDFFFETRGPKREMLDWRYLKETGTTLRMDASFRSLSGEPFSITDVLDLSHYLHVLGHSHGLRAQDYIDETIELEMDAAPGDPVEEE